MQPPAPTQESCRAAACSVLVQLPGLVVVKSLDSRLLAMNAAFARLLGVDPNTAVSGKFEYELAPYLEGAADAFLQQDQQTLQRQRSRFVDVLSYQGGTPRVILAEKSCLVDTDGKPFALLFHGSDLTDRVFGQIGALLEHHVGQARRPKHAPISYAIEAPAQRRALSAREEECLFFLLRGHTARRIAQKLFLSTRTVEGYIEQLKNAFGAASKTALVEQALAEGYGHFLPASLL